MKNKATEGPAKTEDDWLVQNLVRRALERINNMQRIESAFFKAKNSISDMTLPTKAKESDSEIPFALGSGDQKPLNENQDTPLLKSVPEIKP
jgi:hypothetical protein